MALASVLRPGHCAVEERAAKSFPPRASRMAAIGCGDAARSSRHTLESRAIGIASQRTPVAISHAGNRTQMIGAARALASHAIVAPQLAAFASHIRVPCARCVARASRTQIVVVPESRWSSFSVREDAHCRNDRRLPRGANETQKCADWAKLYLHEIRNKLGLHDR